MPPTDPGLRPQIVKAAAKPRKILGQRECDPVPRFDWIVNGVVGIRIANSGCLRRSRSKADRRRRTEKRRNRINPVGIAQAYASIFGSGKTKPKAEGIRITAIFRLIHIGQHLVDIKTGRQRPVEKIRLGEAEDSLLADGRNGDAGAQILSASEQTSLRIAELANDGAGRRIADAEGQLA